MKIYKKVTYKWEKWFAWYPVTTIDDEIVWWETVKRTKEQTRIPNVYPSSWTVYKRIC